MDRISSNPNIHALRAYASTAPAQRPNGAPLTGQTTRTQPVQRTEPIARIGSPTDARPGSDPSRLVAAKVDPLDLRTDVAEIQSTGLRGIAPKVTSAGTYALHPSAAATNAAATGVHAGRALDIRG